MSDISDSRTPRIDGADQQLPLAQSLRGLLRVFSRRREDEDDEDTGGMDAAADSAAAAADPLQAGERLLLRNIRRLSDMSVADCMVPRPDIVALEQDTPMADALRFVVAEGHSRLPVYRETLDSIVGMIHVKDLLAFVMDHLQDLPQLQLSGLVRELPIVVPSMRALDLLLQMRQSGQHMALVIDEFGGIDGLVTIEDLVEEIVGDIRDEHDEAELPEVQRAEDGTVLVDAGVLLEDLEAEGVAGFDAEDREEAETIGGLVTILAGHVPATGEVLEHRSGMRFEVIESDSRRVRQLRIHPAPLADLASPEAALALPPGSVANGAVTAG